jgi:hypothetical protein
MSPPRYPVPRPSSKSLDKKFRCVRILSASGISMLATASLFGLDRLLLRPELRHGDGRAQNERNDELQLPHECLVSWVSTFLSFLASLFQQILLRRHEFPHILGIHEPLAKLN